MYKSITSLQNKALKQVLQLQRKSRTRRKEGLFVIEGFRELKLALQADYVVEKLFFCPDLCSTRQAASFQIPDAKIVEITSKIYHKLAYRGSTEGIMALARSKKHPLSTLEFFRDNPLILVAEAPEKPGNIGALLRTADAANLDAVLLANPRTDLYNPNIIRSSVGCVFTNQIGMGSTAEIIRFLKDKKIALYCASLQAAENYTHQDYTQPTALVVGTEADGLQAEWEEQSTQNILIPMQGQIDSMNVSVAAGILIFEAKRQRRFQ